MMVIRPGAPMRSYSVMRQSDCATAQPKGKLKIQSDNWKLSYGRVRGRLKARQHRHRGNTDTKRHLEILL